MDTQVWRARFYTRCDSAVRQTHQRDRPHSVRFYVNLTDSIMSLSNVNRILKGNLAPGGAVAKITGKEGLGFTGKARAFDTEDDFVHAVESGSIKKGEKTVVILRYLGPKGGPGKCLDCSPSVIRTNLHAEQACLRC